MGLGRREALWAIRGLGDVPLPLFEAADRSRRPGDNRPSVELAGEAQVLLPGMTLGEEVIQDYQSLRLSLKAHPMSLLRRHVAGDGIVTTAEMRAAKDGAWTATAGLVLIRQRPGTSSGVIFATLEDETGIANIIVWPQVYERYRRAVIGGRLLEVRGRLQKEGLVIHLIARHVIDRSPLLRELGRLDGPDQAEPQRPNGRLSTPCRGRGIFGEHQSGQFMGRHWRSRPCVGSRSSPSSSTNGCVASEPDFSPRGHRQGHGLHPKALAGLCPLPRRRCSPQDRRSVSVTATRPPAVALGVSDPFGCRPICRFGRLRSMMPAPPLPLLPIWRVGTRA